MNLSLFKVHTSINVTKKVIESTKVNDIIF